MNRIFLLILWILLCFSSMIEAKGGKLSSLDFNLDIYDSTNPFQSKLPVKKELIAKPTGTPVNSKNTQNQTADLPKKESPELKWKINGIVWNTNRPQAIINDRVVDVGDTVDNAKIIAIRKAELDVELDGKKITIKP